MNGLDWGIIAIIVVSALLAAAHGFFFEIFSLAGSIVGYLLAAWSYKHVAPWFLPYVKNPWVADAAAFLTIFLSVLILAGIIARIAKWAMQEVGLRWIDRLLGALFGVLRGGLIVMAVVMALASFTPNSTALGRSQFAPYFLLLGRGAVWASPYELREKFREGLEALRKRRNESEGVGQQNGPKSSGDSNAGEKK